MDTEQHPNAIPEPRTPPTVAFLMGALVAITAFQLGAVMRAAPTQQPRAAAPSPHMSGQVPALPGALRHT